MTFHLEYTEISQDAMNSLGSLYKSFTKRVDKVAEAENAAWASAWKTYRQTGEGNFDEIVGLMPEWMQFNFQHFANIQRYFQETGKAIGHYEHEITTAYQEGLRRGRELETTKDQQAWRSQRTWFDRARELERVSHPMRLLIRKEEVRNRTKELARVKWPELFSPLSKT